MFDGMSDAKTSRANRTPLPRPYFIENLLIEKLRAERSRTELSLIIITLEKDKPLEDSHTKSLLLFLMTANRASDIIGILDTHIIALLLPDTGLLGAQKVARNINQEAGHTCTGITVFSYPDNVFDHLISQSPEYYNIIQFISSGDVKKKPVSDMTKRVIDLLGSVSGLLILSPLMLMIALSIKATSPGDIFYKQNRLGKEGRAFTLLKFRSMYQNSSEKTHQDYVTHFIQGNPLSHEASDISVKSYKLQSDPRITPLGKILRKTSMDELPQLFNVIKGDMSLVGPRPAIGYEAKQYQAWHLRRILSMKPGITGLWQVEGRSRTSFDEMVRMDIRYIQNWTLWLDIKILFKTVYVVLLGRGAL